MTIAAATSATLPSAGEINTSASSSQPLGAKSSDPAERRVTVYGIRHEPSAKDLNTIRKNKNIVPTYKSANSAVYCSTASETKKTAVSVLDKVDFTLSFCSGCRWCPNSRGRCRH
jgi:hypothetical protein